MMHSIGWKQNKRIASLRTEEIQIPSSFPGEQIFTNMSEREKVLTRQCFTDGESKALASGGCETPCAKPQTEVWTEHLAKLSLRTAIHPQQSLADAHTLLPLLTPTHSHAVQRHRAQHSVCDIQIQLKCPKQPEACYPPGLICLAVT